MPAHPSQHDELASPRRDESEKTVWNYLGKFRGKDRDALHLKQRGSGSVRLKFVIRLPFLRSKSTQSAEGYTWGISGFLESHRQYQVLYSLRPRLFRFSEKL